MCGGLGHVCISKPIVEHVERVNYAVDIYVLRKKDIHIFVSCRIVKLVNQT